jgi:CDP-glucose 4,6-dehydratase
MDLALGKRLRELPGPILVTGHTGFKGTWLTLLLQHLDVPVIGLSLAPEAESLFSRAGRTGAIPESFIDIRDFDKVSRFMSDHQPSAVIHMAAQPIVLESYRTPRETFETNVIGTVNLLDSAFNTESVKAVVVVTTDKVYRNDNSGVPFTESDALAGKDPYSASKVGAESAVAAWQQISKVVGGPKVIAVRAGNVIGGGDWAENRIIPELVRGFSTGATVVIRNPQSTRPWQHVLDPLHGYLMALEALLRGSSSQALNFGPDSRSFPVQEVVEQSQKSWPFPTSVEFSGGSDDPDVESIALQLDSTRAREALGWKPFWSQSESIRSTIEWWDKVLNDSVDPVNACQTDIDFLLNNARGLGIS